MKKFVSLLGIALLTFAVLNAEESKIAMYARAEAGYYSGGAIIKTDLGGSLLNKQDVTFPISGLEVTPTFGLTLPVVFEQNFGTLKMGAEVQVPVVIGNYPNYGTTGNALIIDPGLMIMENYYFPQTMPQAIQNLSAKVGVGFSVPISIVTTETFSGTGVGFNLNFLLGLQYDFTKHISANIDWNLGTFGVLSSSIRAGVSWRF